MSSGVRHRWSALVDSGVLIPTNSNSRASEWHRTEAERLLRRAKSTHDRRLAFLARYDALMRTVESEISAEGAEFGGSPHEAMRLCFSQLVPHFPASELKRLSVARHRIKKGPSTPTEQENQLLIDAIHQVRRDLRL